MEIFSHRKSFSSQDLPVKFLIHGVDESEVRRNGVFRFGLDDVPGDNFARRDRGHMTVTEYGSRRRRELVTSPAIPTLLVGMLDIPLIILLPSFSLIGILGRSRR